MKAAILGKKIGMTSIYLADGRQMPCTVVQAGPCPVIQVKTKKIDGYTAVQVGFDDKPERLVNKPLKKRFEIAGVKPKRYLREFRDLEPTLKLGEELTLEQFKKGDKVVVSGTSIGRGFQGVVKRHHFGGVGMTTHGQSDRVRAPGSIGSSSYPSRVFKGLRMAGRMGGNRRTVRNLEVVDILSENNIILIKGSVPGAKNSLLEIIKK
jgi:large subunit ribosomal protein L3